MSEFNSVLTFLPNMNYNNKGKSCVHASELGSNDVCWHLLLKLDLLYYIETYSIHENIFLGLFLSFKYWVWGHILIFWKGQIAMSVHIPSAHFGLSLPHLTKTKIVRCQHCWLNGWHEVEVGFVPANFCLRQTFRLCQRF